MCDINELEATLRNSEDIQLSIVRDIGSFTVALFAVFDSPHGERLALAGTGTLFAVGGSCFILTAAHVWEEVLRPAARVGITLDANIDHSFWLDVATIVAYGPPRTRIWDERGPDMTFLRVPPEHLGTINAYRVFYDPVVDGARGVDGDALETHVLLGTPAALGEFTRNHANILINGFFVDADLQGQTQGGFDYFDLEMDISAPGTPETFGGVSGGGLWKVQAYYSRQTGNIDWNRTLVGVAFWQSGIENGRRTIRCHGPESIRIATTFVRYLCSASFTPSAYDRIVARHPRLQNRETWGTPCAEYFSHRKRAHDLDCTLAVGSE